MAPRSICLSRYVSVAALFTVIILGTASQAHADAQPGAAELPEAAGPIVNATMLELPRPGEKLGIVVQWPGALPVQIRAWIDLDGDNIEDSGELVLSENIDEPIEVLEIEMPTWIAPPATKDLYVTVDRTGEIAPVQQPKDAGTCSWAEDFHVDGTAGLVYAMEVFDDGTGPALYAGGLELRTGCETEIGDVAKWDGTSWSSLGALGGAVNDLVFFDDGSGPALYVAGEFTEGIKKWNGSSWTSLGSGLNSSANALEVFDDGSGSALYVGGRFWTAGGVSANRVAKWDGLSWSALGSGAGSSAVYCLEVFNDGTGSALYVGGNFYNAGGISASRIAKWDGSSWSALGNGVNDWVHALAVFDDGTGAALYAGGRFDVAGSVWAYNMARWDGASWSALGPGTGSVVKSLAVYDDGGGDSLYVGGGFTSADGGPGNYIAEWDGSSWYSLGDGVDGFVNDMMVLDTGSGAALHVGGSFAMAGGSSASNIAAWNGTSWSRLCAGGNGLAGPNTNPSYALAVRDLGTGPALYAGGSFKAAGGVAANQVARWNGSSWTSLGSDFDLWSVHAIETFDSGSGPELYVGGDFLSIDYKSRIAKWDGSTWSQVGGGINGTVYAFAVFDDGSGLDLYVGGYFSVAGYVSGRNNIARWSGSSWSNLGSGMSARVYAFVVHDDGSGQALYAGGSFTTAGGNAANRIARWDGSTWTALGSGLDGAVNTLTTFDTGAGAELYAGGDFTTAGGSPANYVARWDGSSWSPLGTGLNGEVMVLSVCDDGDGPGLCAGGDFTTAGGSPASFLARWDGTSWSSLGSGTNDVVYSLATFDYGSGPELYAIGAFTTAGSFVSNRIAKWSCTCDCSRTINANEWTMIGLPCAQSPGTVQDVLGDDLIIGDYDSRWAVVARDEQANSYQLLTLGDTLEQGEGYWIQSFDAATIDAGGAPTSTLCPSGSEYSECFDIELEGSSGRTANLVSHPFSSSVPWADVRFVDASATEYTPADAETAGIAEKTMYLWNGSAYEPYDGETAGMEGALSEFTGMWVFANQDLTLRIPTARELASSLIAEEDLIPLKTEVEASKALLPGEWYLRVIVSAGSMSDPGNVLGQLSDSHEGKDRHDLEELTPFGDRYLTAVFPHPEWPGGGNYASDFHSVRPGQPDSWYFEVHSDDSQREVSLLFEGPAEILSLIALRDELAATVFPLNAKPTYTFTMGATEHAFTLLLRSVPSELFSDDFESGDTRRWTLKRP